MFATRFLDIPPLESVAGVVRVPGSKSISNRALLLAGFASGTTIIAGLLHSDDTRVMLDALAVLVVASLHALGRRWVLLAGTGLLVAMLTLSYVAQLVTLTGFYA